MSEPKKPRRSPAPEQDPQAAPPQRALVSGDPCEPTPGAGEKTTAREHTGALFPIACVTASIGGERALSTLLKQIPADTQLALVVIYQGAPSAGAFDALALHECLLPTSDLGTGTRLQPGNLYVLPPGAQATLADGQIQLAERRGDAGRIMPADVFLRSLAREIKSSAIAVILSGAGSDGALGLKDVKAEGGITFAEDPRFASAPSMPQNALAAGCVDFTLDLQGLAAELVRVGRADFPLSPTPADGLMLAADQDFSKLFTLLNAGVGVDFTHYKKNTLKRRIQRRIVLRRLRSLHDYMDYLESHPAELHELYQDLLIKVTAFFRDPDAFAALKTHVFPVLMHERPPNVPMRIWVPGCSTGEEVYSLAISLLEFLEVGASGQPIQIFGTDVSEAAIQRARSGFYLQNIALDVSQSRLRRFFVNTEGGYQINKTIRDLCIFSRHNVAADPPFSKLDLISCRNVMIYLEPSLQRRLLHTFHYALRSTGFLILGSSEGTGTLPDLFGIVDKTHKIFCKKPATGKPYSFPLAQKELHGERVDALDRPSRAVDEVLNTTSVREEADGLIMAHYAPAGVVIDEGMQIIQFRGKTGPYLEPAPGEASLHLFKMAREGLLLDLRAVIHAAIRSGNVARREAIKIRRGDELRSVNVEVWPLMARLPQGKCFLVIFTEYDQLDGDQPSNDPRRSAHREELVTAHLRKELVKTRDYLQSIIEELEATNEELKSANEEILASNEELHSINEEIENSKEELQSSNEELTTVNEELRSSNTDLGRSNDGLRSLLNSVNIPILLLDADLRIRRFTSAAEKLLALTSADIGGALAEILLRVAWVDLASLVAQVIGARSITERQVQDAEGRWHVMRIRPFRTLNDELDGAAIWWLDIDMLKRAD